MAKSATAKKAAKPAKKAAKAKVGTNGAKKTVAAKATKKSTIPVEDVVKMMQRKDGVTLGQMQEAGFWQPAIAAFKAALRRDLKPKKVKEKGAPTVYSCAKG